ncbi:MAG: hypothetical protein ACTSYD_02180 [Candidatus Heimdallarchaeaceae archaeon]
MNEKKKIQFFLILIGFITGLFVGKIIYSPPTNSVNQLVWACSKIEWKYKCADGNTFSVFTDANTCGVMLVGYGQDCNLLEQKCASWELTTRRVVNE